MIPSSWKTLTSSKLSNIRDYVAQKDYKGTYESIAARVKGGSEVEWNGHGTRDGLPGTSSIGIEKLSLFPGWAVRRFRKPSDIEDENAGFFLEIYISGFASSVRPPEAATRSQKAFYRLAKSYAALPKLSNGNDDFEARLNDDECEGLAEDLKELEFDDSLFPVNDHPSRSTTGSSSSDPNSNSSSSSIPEKVLQSLHDNLDARIRLFWTSAIANRTVNLSVFCPMSGKIPTNADDTLHGQDTDFTPLFTKSVITSSEGSFQSVIRIPWEQLATHPPSLHLAFGDRNAEYPIIVQAEMWPPVDATSVQLPSSSYATYQRRTPPASASSMATTLAVDPQSRNPAARTCVRTQITVVLPAQRVPIRVVSDIDDTVKFTGVIEGAKAAFRNAFTRHLSDLVIPDMVKWYRDLWKNGVRFHYVSNGPFELLPIITEFFHVSNLPEGSIRLKSYKARSLLSSLLSPPAVRKRQGVVDVLDAFPESVFLLVGDSGEQDLELYTELARERPHQIAGIFIRNVTTLADVIPNTTYGIAYGSAGGGVPPPLITGTLVSREPQQIRQMPSMENLSNNLITPQSEEAPRLNRSQSFGNGLTPEEKRIIDFIYRVERARTEIPSYIVLKIFKDPTECESEITNILRRYH
ncbi:hypothetical protein Clacol_005335 [Clathrus columnatus]|uniref:Phosphatidate phosphatase APP1 catalytic domain-containing protein n=1 Tax=Clathrus columnatus TaxID=1419009 RepID=A0AAV5AD43_9AGAM|nr:hypothetical protein Clacol_005335 [Clathrus columnatus]